MNETYQVVYSLGPSHIDSDLVMADSVSEAESQIRNQFPGCLILEVNLCEC